MVFGKRPCWLDKLRSNSINLVNQLANINDAIKDLNESNKTSAIPKYGTKLNDSNDYAYENLSGGTEFRNAKGDPIRFGTVAKRLGYTDADQILGMAQKTLPESEYNRLKNIYNMQRNTSHPNFVFNVGPSFTPNTANYLSESDRGFLDSLGLAFGS